MNDETSYKNVAMQDLAAQIARLRNQYNDITGNLESNVTNLRNYWVEDTDALAVLEELQEQFKGYKAYMDRGFEQMTRFEKIVKEQIDRYGGAETQTRRSIRNG